MAIDRVKLDQTTDSDELLKMLQEWDEEENQRYQVLHHEWEKNVLFFLGKQWLEDRGTSTTDGYTILEEDDDHFRPVTNYSSQLADLKRSQVLGKNLRSKVQSNSDNKDDRDASRLGTLALKAKHQIDNEEELQNLLFLHSQIFGICWRSDVKQPHPYEVLRNPVTERVRDEFFQCTTPDCNYISADSSLCPQCGNDQMQHVVDDREEPVLNEMGEPMIEEIPVFQNKVFVHDPFRIKVSPSSSKNDITWLTESTIQDVSWVKDSFNVNAPGYLPENLDKVKKKDKLPRGLKISEEFKQTVIHNHSSLFKDISKTTESSKGYKNDCDTTILRKSYFCPTKAFVKGRLIIWTDTAIVYDGDPDVPIPVSKTGRKKIKRWHGYNFFNYKVNPMSIEGISFLTDLIPINKKLNSLDAIILEHLEKCATPTEVHFDNVNMNQDDATDGILEISGNPSLPNGGAPFYLNVPQLASEVYRMRQDVIQEMEKIARVTEVVQGLRPAGVDTYRGLQLLRDAADSADSELYSRWYSFFRESQQLKLAIIQECLVEADEDLIEMMDIIRQNENMGKEQVEMFTGQDLRNNLNVMVEETDYMSQTKSAEADKVRAALADKLMTPEQVYDPLIQLQMFRRLGMGEMPLPKKADIEKAERIIQYLESGMTQEIQQSLSHIDDKPLQIRVWTNWMKTAKFESLDENIKQAAQMLLKSVEDQLMKARQEQIKQQMKNPQPQPRPDRGGRGAPPPQRGAPPPQRGAPPPQRGAQPRPM